MTQPFHARTGLAVPLLVALALLLNAVYVAAGFTVDDFALLGLFRQDPLPFSRWKGVWAVQEVSFFESLWYFGSDWEGAFWRPIPSLIIEGSLRLFGENAAPLHALAILCHAWIGAGIYLLIRKLTGRTLVAFLSALFFVTSEKLGMVVGWVATLTDPLCVSLVVGSLLAHATWLKERRKGAWILAFLLMVLAYPCKESAVLTPVLLAMLTFFAPQGHMPEEGIPGTLSKRVRALLSDWASWLPGMVFLAIYLVIYKVYELGRMNNLMYVSPLEDPLGYVPHLLLHLPAMWLGTLSPFWPSFTMFEPRLLGPVALAGIFALATWVWALWPLRRDPLVQWSFLAYNLVLLPQMSADASERGLYLPLVLAGPALAVLVVRLAPLARRLYPHEPPAPLWTRLCGGWAALGVLVPGALLSLFMGPAMIESNGVGMREVETAVPVVLERKPQFVVFLNTSGMMSAFYPYPVLNLKVGPTDVRVLSSASVKSAVERLDSASIILRVDRKGWLSNMFARLVRTDPVVAPGRFTKNDLFQTTILEVTPKGDDALAVRFDFRYPLDDPRYLFLTWNGEAYVPLDLAALPQGRITPLHDASDIWASLM